MSATQAGAAASKKAESKEPSSGTLDIKDSRNGKSYSVPILMPGTEGDTTIRAMDLRQIKQDAGEFGLMTYDPAFMNTAAIRSSSWRRMQRSSRSRGC
jgi:citrate synthase